MLIRRVWVVGAVALLCLGCNRAPEQPKVQPRGVLTETVKVGAAATLQGFAGEVRARHEVSLGFRVGGKLSARTVNLGDTVKAGQVLAHLDPADLRQSQQVSEADLAALAADLRLARVEVERTRTLKASGFVSQAALDSKETVLRAAEERHAAAQNRVGLARNQAAYAVLHAHADGVIAQTLAESGQVVTAGQAIVRVAQDGEKEVVISVPENRIAEFSRGRTLRLSFWALPGATTVGRVREVAPQADAVTRSFVVRVSLTEAVPLLRLGMSATVSLDNGVMDSLISLPATAIFQKDRRPAVWVVQAGRVQLRPVEVVTWGNGTVSIRAGLHAGEVVVRAGGHALIVGEAVTPLAR